MKRALLVSLVATGLLAGCVTGDYVHRADGRGDYYYGQPSVEYRYEDVPYGLYPYGSFRFGYGSPYGYYRSPYHYGYYGPYYGYPYYYNPPRYRPRPPARPGEGGNGSEGRRPSWRDIIRNESGDRPAPTSDRLMRPREEGGNGSEGRRPSWRDIIRNEGGERPTPTPDRVMRPREERVMSPREDRGGRVQEILRRGDGERPRPSTSDER